MHIYFWERIRNQIILSMSHAQQTFCASYLLRSLKLSKLEIFLPILSTLPARAEIYRGRYRHFEKVHNYISLSDYSRLVPGLHFGHIRCVSNWCQNFLKKLETKSVSVTIMTLVITLYSFEQHNWHLVPDFFSILYYTWRMDNFTMWICFYPYDPWDPWLIWLIHFHHLNLVRICPRVAL